jgi:hypothetical protein
LFAVGGSLLTPERPDVLAVPDDQQAEVAPAQEFAPAGEGSGGGQESIDPLVRYELGDEAS